MDHDPTYKKGIITKLVVVVENTNDNLIRKHYCELSIHRVLAFILSFNQSLVVIFPFLKQKTCCCGAVVVVAVAT